jgi:tetratricopeptide (TPR) repeat protein
MQSEDTALEQIDRYLNGEMTPEEMENFRQELSRDHELASLFREERLLRDVIQDDRRRALKRQLHAGQPGRKISWFRSKPLMSAAAVLLIGTVITVVFWYLPQTPEQLYRTFIKQEKPVSFTKMSDQNDSLKVIENLLNSDEYQQAIPLMEMRIGDSLFNSTNNRLRFQLGIAYLHTGAEEQAVLQFDVLIQNDALEKGQALLYKALIKLKQKDIEACRSLLNQTITVSEKIQDTETLRKARALLKELPPA